jgi:hypothetical protein
MNRVERRFKDLAGATHRPGRKGDRMPPHKPAKPAAPQTSCDRGPDVPLLKLEVSTVQVVTFDFFYCFTPGHMIVRLDDTVLVDRPVPPPATVHVTIGPLSPGHHILSWLFHPVNLTWKAVSEISVDGVVKRRQTDDKSSPLHLVLDSVFLEVK